MQRTQGLNPKVPIQALVSVAVFFAAFLGFELDAEAAGILAAVIGFVGGYFAPPAPTVPADPA